MAGTISVVRTDHEVTINVKGRFTFELYDQFRDAYRQNTTDTSKKLRFVVDMAGTEYIDSSALGVLLLLREECGCLDNDDVTLTNVRPEIRNILETANFQRIFTIT